MNKKKRMLILKTFETYYSNSHIDLRYRTSFELLIAIMLSAKSSDIQVNKVTKRLFLQISHPSDVLKIGVLQLKSIICTVGLFNRKAIYIFETCRILVQIYRGIIPLNIDQLLCLPGVGRKTANLFLNVILKKNFIAVDTHVFRLSNRTRFATGKSELIVEKKLLRVVPVPFQTYIHTWFVSHGRYVCMSKTPKCLYCVIHDFCEYSYKTC